MDRIKIKDKLDKSTPLFIISYAVCFTIGFLITFGVCTAIEAKAGFTLLFSPVVGVGFALGLRTWLMGDERPAVFRKSGSSLAYVIFGSVLAFLSFLLVYMSLGVYPFGDRSVLIIDMHHQYVSFFSLLRDKFYSLFSGDSLFYSTKVGLGSGFISLFAYYLSSPLNFIVLLFPRSLLTEAIALITVIKMGCAGLTFSVMFRRIFKDKGLTAPILSVAYAVCAYMIVYSWDIMWLDSIILLPLCVYGMHLMFERKRPVLYVLSLAGVLITNYYIGYMICIFLVLYFFAYLIAESKGLTVKAMLKKGAAFAVCSLTGGALGAFLLIPTYKGLQTTYGADDVFARDVKTYFNLFDLFGRSMFSPSPSLRGDALPNIYCSVFAVLLICIFFLCKGISLRRKVAFGGLLAVLCVCASINWTYFAFHGFHWPSDLPHRFSFLITFMMLYIACDVLAHFDSVTSGNVGTGLFICIGCLALTEMLEDKMNSVMAIFVSLLFFVLYAVVMLLASRKTIARSFASFLLIFLVFLEITLNGAMTIDTMRATEVYTKREDFVSDYPVVSEAVDIVDSYNKPQYRTELLPRKTCNDASLFGYSGLTVFASSNCEAVIDLMGHFGYAVNGVNSHMYHSYVPLIDSILNLRYLIFDRDSQLSHAQLEYLDQVASDGDMCYIYKNPYALSRGFVVDDAMHCTVSDGDFSEWDYSSGNPFEVQNSFVSTATGTAASDSDVYTMLYPATSDVLTNGCNVTFDECFFHASPTGSSGFSFTTVVSASDTAQHYVYVDCSAASSISVESGTNDYSSSPHEPYIIDLGTVKKGHEIYVTINTDGECVGNVYIASMDNDRFEKAISALGRSQLEIDTYSEDYLKGSVTTAKNGVMFTSIPYDTGWKAKVDGKKVETYPIGEALLGFDVPSGSHVVELSYTPSGLVIGIVISVLALIGLALMVVFFYDKPRRYVENKFGIRLSRPAAPVEPVAVPEALPEGFVVSDDLGDTDNIE